MPVGCGGKKGATSLILKPSAGAVPSQGITISSINDYTSHSSYSVDSNNFHTLVVGDGGRSSSAALPLHVLGRSADAFMCHCDGRYASSACLVAIRAFAGCSCHHFGGLGLVGGQWVGGGWAVGC